MNFRSAVPLDVHVIRIANRDYKLGSQEKGLTEKMYFEISNKLQEIWGSDAGWVQAVLFYNEVQMQAKRPEANARKKGKRKGKKENNIAIIKTAKVQIKDE